MSAWRNRDALEGSGCDHAIPMIWIGKHTTEYNALLVSTCKYQTLPRSPI